MRPCRALILTRGRRRHDGKTRFVRHIADLTAGFIFTCRHTCPKKKAITAVMFSVFCTAYTFTTHASDPRRAGKTSEPAHFQQTVLNVAPSVWRRISPLAYLFSQKQTIFAQEMAHLKTLSTFRLSKHILEASCCQEARKFWTRTQILHRWGLLVLFNIS